MTDELIVFKDKEFYSPTSSKEFLGDNEQQERYVDYIAETSTKFFTNRNGIPFVYLAIDKAVKAKKKSTRKELLKDCYMNLIDNFINERFENEKSFKDANLNKMIFIKVNFGSFFDMSLEGNSLKTLENFYEQEEIDEDDIFKVLRHTTKRTAKIAKKYSRGIFNWQ